VLLTNRMDWSAEQIVAGYSGQQQIERVFRGLKQGDWTRDPDRRLRRSHSLDAFIED
jgi:transposase